VTPGTGRRAVSPVFITNDDLPPPIMIPARLGLGSAARRAIFSPQTGEFHPIIVVDVLHDHVVHPVRNRVLAVAPRRYADIWTGPDRTGLMPCLL
jgi:hypothetical protein